MVGNGRKFGPAGPSERPEDALAVASDAAEASENSVPVAAAAERAGLLSRAGSRAAWADAGRQTDPNRRSPNAAEVDEGRPDLRAPEAGAGTGAPALPLPFLADRRPAEAVQFDPKRRPPRGLSDGAEASDRDPAGAPSPALPKLAGWDGRSARAGLPEPGAQGGRPGDRRDAGPGSEHRLRQFPAPSAPAGLKQAGGDGGPAPADADACLGPRGGSYEGVSSDGEGWKPESAGPRTRGANPPALPLRASALSGRLAALAETAKTYARSAQSDNTQRAYSADWKMFASWLRRQGLSETPPDPEAVGLYLAAQVERRGAELSVATLERRLSGIAWRYRQMGAPLDIRDRHIATVLAGIRRRHGRPPAQKAAVFADELLAMLATLEMDLRGIRDRAILAIGFAGGLRRSEIVGLDCGPDQTEDGAGWVEIFREGALLTIRGKTGWREVEIGRGSRPDTCPVALLETWLRLGRISHGPLFRAIARKNGGVSGARLTDKHVVRLVKTCALAAGLRGDLTEGERRLAFGGHSLRAGLASSAQIEEAHVQKHLGHASAEMTRRYQRKRDRFTINLTKAAGL